MRAAQVFGFHLATVDLRQSSDQHEEVVAELLATARVEADYRALDETARRALLKQVDSRQVLDRKPGGDHQRFSPARTALGFGKSEYSCDLTGSQGLGNPEEGGRR